MRAMCHNRSIFRAPCPGFPSGVVAEYESMNLLTTRIDLDAIAYNTRLLKDMAGDAKLMAVVKADGYNHGMDKVAPVMAANGADAFGVATIPEALALRASGITAPVLCWIWSAEQDWTAAVDASIDLAVISPQHARVLIDAPLSDSRRVRVSIKVDTALHRSGVDEDDWDEVFTMLRDANHIEVTGLFSHLSCADEPHNEETDRQAVIFRRAIARAQALGLDVPTNHLCNSPATLTRPDLYFDMVRPGVALYGMEPINGLDHGLRPAMSWIGAVTVVKPIKKGEGTSYSLTWRAESDGFLAVVPAGYADGVPRAAQDHIRVNINGHYYSQVGRICMDQFVVFLGDNPHAVTAGDEAVIFGEQGMSATELADALGTINYEVICRPTGRTVREYTGEDK